MRTLLALAALLGAGGLTPAGPDGYGKDGVTVKTLSARDVAETVDGKEARATTVEVTIGPGQGSPPTGTRGRCSATSWRASTSGASTTGRW